MEINPSTPDDQPEWLPDGQPPSEYDDMSARTDAYVAPDIVPVDEAEDNATASTSDTDADSVEISPESDIQEFRANIVEEVKGGLHAAVEQLTSGDDHYFDAQVIGELLRDMAQDAAQQGNIAEVDQHIDTLDKLPGAYRGSFVDACFAGIEAGSTQSFTLLSERLADEKAQTQAELAAIDRGEELSDDALLDSEDALLFEVLHTCEENNIAPGAWFDKYATDSTHRWTLYSHFYRGKMAEHDVRMGDVPAYSEAAYDPGPHFASDREHFDQVAADLADNPDFAEEMVVDNARLTLLYAKDPAVRARLVERYKQVILEADTSHVMFKDLTAIGAEVLDDPDLATQDNANYFTAAINMIADRLQRTGIDGREYLLGKSQLGWRMAFAHYEGATSDELVDILQQHATPLFPSAQEGSTHAAHRNADLQAHHDYILFRHAMRAANEGSFDDVKTYMAATIESEIRESILQQALSYVTSLEEIAPLRPTGIEAVVYPELNMHIAFTEARLSGDPTRLAGFVHEYRAGVDFDDDTMSTTKYLINEANRLLAIQTGTTEVGADAEPSLPAPTLESLQQRYNTIQQEENPTERLRALWGLAQQVPH
jgi:hypothetical protein